MSNAKKSSSTRSTTQSTKSTRKRNVGSGSSKRTTRQGSTSSTMPKKTMAQKRRASKILADFYRFYPDAHCELEYNTPHELLIATILSAQATDVGVNKATPALFRAFPQPADYASATPEELEAYIRTIGLFRNKAKAIHAAMTTIVQDFDGEVPKTMEDLLTLRGVARKTANVVLGNAFGINEGVVVDTHVARISQRFGLTRETRPDKIEKDLMSLFPREDWTMLSHMMIFHGRRACKARNAMCAEHELCRAYCSNAKSTSKEQK